MWRRDVAKKPDLVAFNVFNGELNMCYTAL